MKLTFFGAAREVTGSCYLAETKQTRVLIDCGMYQGSAFADAKNYEAFPFDPTTIDAVAMTHAHLDHVGRLPKLVKEGLNGTIYGTPPTCDIAGVVMENAESLMCDEEERECRPRLYTIPDVKKTLRHMKGVDYSQWVTVGDIRFRFRDAGHIFGSAFIELEEKDGARVIFSGDLGNRNAPFLRPTAQPATADAIVVESTYGNRIHENLKKRTQMLHNAIVKTVKRRGVLLIPAFAVERTQEMLYEMNKLVEEGKMPRVDVYVDSPMGIKITDIIKRYPKYYDTEALRRLTNGTTDLFRFPSLHRTLSRDESKAINVAPWPKVIVAGSGMMHGGRIMHHLIRYLSNPKTTLLIVGYQAQGTLGRKLYEGATRVTIMNEQVQVKASIVPIGAYSAHADQDKLLEWIHESQPAPKHIFCTHGEEGAAVALATRIQKDLHLIATAPKPGEQETL
jgi:metallo-beta-lactamase family protein